MAKLTGDFGLLTGELARTADTNFLAGDAGLFVDFEAGDLPFAGDFAFEAGDFAFEAGDFAFGAGDLAFETGEDGLELEGVDSPDL